MGKANPPVKTEGHNVRRENSLIAVACLLFFAFGFYVIITSGGGVIDVLGILVLTAFLAIALHLERKYRVNSNQSEEQ